MKTQSKLLVDILEFRRSADTRGVSRFNLGKQVTFRDGVWTNKKDGSSISSFLLWKNTNQPNRNTGNLQSNSLNITPH